jgi:hypothetical protein
MAVHVRGYTLAFTYQLSGLSFVLSLGDDVVRPELAGRANATNDADRRLVVLNVHVINVHEHGGAFARLDQLIELRVASGIEPFAVAVHLPGGARHQPHRLLLAVEVLPARWCG